MVHQTDSMHAGHFFIHSIKMLILAVLGKASNASYVIEITRHCITAIMRRCCIKFYPEIKQIMKKKPISIIVMY